MLDVEFAQLSDSGRERQNNEDYVGCAGPPERRDDDNGRGWLFALADGVGGQEKGEVASREAVERLLSDFRATSGSELLPTLLPKLVQAANAAIFEIANAEYHGRSSMATTLVACALRYDSAVVSHVGDSRCYLIRRGVATALTRDHTLANDQVRLGIVSSREARISPTRQMLTRSLGHDLIANVDTCEHRVNAGDVLLLCSDGLHGPVSEEEIGAIVAGFADLHEAARELVSLANRKDGSDNISVQLIRVRDVERVGMYRGRPYKLR
jgi:serine/threonine protein phosphatase PrpC